MKIGYKKFTQKDGQSFLTPGFNNNMVMLLNKVSKSKIIVEVAHVTEIYGPVQALKDYIENNIKKKWGSVLFYYIAHPLIGGNIRYSKVYNDGRCIKEYPKSKNEYIQYIKEFVLTTLFLIKLRKVDIYIGTTNFDTIPAIILRFLHLVDVKAVVFYTVDYSEKRFDNLLLNSIYKLFDIFCVKFADFVISNNKRVAEIRLKQGLKKEKCIIARNGVYLNRIPTKKTVTKDANKKLYFVGHLTKTHGILEIIEAIEYVIKEIPDIKLFVIGSGPDEFELKKLVNEKNLSNNVIFMGRLENKEVLEILSNGGVGLAPYTLEEDWVKYCDPVKVKEYLACGCPVIISNIPEIAEEIEKCKAGFKYKTLEELKNAILYLAKNYNKFIEFRNNALELGKKYDWNKIYGNVFRIIFNKIYKNSK